MNTESSETVLILQGDRLFKSGVQFHWKQCASGMEKGLWIFKTGGGKLMSAKYHEIFVDAQIKIDPDSNCSLLENLADYTNYQPTVLELHTN